MGCRLVGLIALSACVQPALFAQPGPILREWRPRESVAPKRPPAPPLDNPILSPAVEPAIATGSTSLGTRIVVVNNSSSLPPSDIAASPASAPPCIPCPAQRTPLYSHCRPWPGGSAPLPDPLGAGSPTSNPPDAGLREGAFARGREGGGQSSATAAPGFDGDFAGITYSRRIGDGRVVRVPVLSRYSGIKITDNDGPRPTDRIALGYNFYDRVNPSLNPGLGAVTLQRQMIGFEKTFLDGSASFGMRLPYGDISGSSGVGTSGIGDLSFLYKYSWYDDRRTGDCISTCLILTTPTGNDPDRFADGGTPPRSWIIQTAACFVKNYEWGYIQGATSLVAPTDSRDPILVGNTLSAGCWLARDRRDRFVTGVVPVAEVHVTTPLNQRDPNGNVYVQDQVNITNGLHFITSRGTISPAIGFPLLSPVPWRVEFVLNVNLRY